MRCHARLALAAAALRGVRSAPSWTPLGAPLQHDAIEAAAIDFDDASGAPVVAYAFANATQGGSTIAFVEFNATTSTWTTAATHTPQFAQPYDQFSFRARNRVLYLGLRIVESAFNLSSVLRGGGGFDGFEGCYAFSGEVWDFEVTAQGDLRSVESADNATAGLTTYNHTGYDGYPAADTWSPLVPVFAGAAGSLDDITVVRTGGDALWTAISAGGNTTVGMTTLSTSSEWIVAGGGVALAGDQAAVAWAPWAGCETADRRNVSAGASQGIVCAARFVNSAGGGATADVAVSCVSEHDLTKWLHLTPPPSLGGVHAGLPASLTLLPPSTDGTVTLVAAAVDGVNASVLHTAVCTLDPQSCPTSFGCDSWETLDLPAAQPITQFQLKAPVLGQGVPSADATTLVLSGGSGTGGDTLSMFRLALAR